MKPFERRLLVVRSTLSNWSRLDVVLIRPCLFALLIPAAAAMPIIGEPILAAASQRDALAFIWPVPGDLMVSFCYCSGEQSGRRTAIDIAAHAGGTVRAAAPGYVAYAKAFKQYPRLILIRHGEGWVTAYAGIERSLVKSGGQVRQGEPIAAFERKAGPAAVLRFEMRRGTEVVDPLDYLPARE
jgi:septal ring factor EnvC (AmiA/AmiB activator)